MNDAVLLKCSPWHCAQGKVGHFKCCKVSQIGCFIGIDRKIITWQGMINLLERADEFWVTISSKITVQVSWLHWNIVQVICFKFCDRFQDLIMITMINGERNGQNSTIVQLRLGFITGTMLPALETINAALTGPQNCKVHAHVQCITPWEMQLKD